VDSAASRWASSARSSGEGLIPLLQEGVVGLRVGGQLSGEHRLQRAMFGGELGITLGELERALCLVVAHGRQVRGVGRALGDSPLDCLAQAGRGLQIFAGNLASGVGRKPGQIGAAQAAHDCEALGADAGLGRAELGTRRSLRGPRPAEVVDLTGQRNRGARSRFWREGVVLVQRSRTRHAVVGAVTGADLHQPTAGPRPGFGVGAEGGVERCARKVDPRVRTAHPGLLGRECCRVRKRALFELRQTVHTRKGSARQEQARHG
jgi:hypothetical protein